MFKSFKVINLYDGYWLLFQRHKFHSFLPIFKPESLLLQLQLNAYKTCNYFYFSCFTFKPQQFKLIFSTLQLIFYFHEQMKRKNGRKGNGVNLETAQLYDKITKLETSILEKIQELKSIPKIVDCEHVTKIQEFSQMYDSNCNYYDKFWKQFMTNVLMMKHIKSYQDQNIFLQKKLKKLEVVQHQIQEKFQERKAIIGPYDKKSYRQRSVKWTCQICAFGSLDEDGFLLHMKHQHQADMEEGQIGHAIDDIFEDEESSHRIH